MPKSSKKKIDEDERKFLKILQKNSGDSIEQIAKKCGFSRQKVWRIKKRLENSNTIWGYNAVIDDEQLGMKQYLILIKRTHKPISKGKFKTIINGELRQKFTNLGVDIDFCYYVHGCYDFALCATSRDVRLTKRFCEELNKVFEDCISDIQVLEVIFPLQKNGFDNPDLDGILEYFTTR